MFKFIVALNASQSEAGWTQTPHFKTVVFALLASTPFYTFEIRGVFKPDSLVQHPSPMSIGDLPPRPTLCGLTLLAAQGSLASAP